MATFRPSRGPDGTPEAPSPADAEATTDEPRPLRPGGRVRVSPFDDNSSGSVRGSAMRSANCGGPAHRAVARQPAQAARGGASPKSPVAGAARAPGDGGRRSDRTGGHSPRSRRGARAPHSRLQMKKAERRGRPREAAGTIRNRHRTEARRRALPAQASAPSPDREYVPTPRGRAHDARPCPSRPADAQDAARNGAQWSRSECPTRRSREPPSAG